MHDAIARSCNAIPNYSLINNFNSSLKRVINGLFSYFDLVPDFAISLDFRDISFDKTCDTDPSMQIDQTLLFGLTASYLILTQQSPRYLFLPHGQI